MLSFETVCKHWETALADFTKNFSDGSIPALINVEWDFSKKKIGVCEAEEDGRKKRCRGMGVVSEVCLNSMEAEVIWDFFEQFSKEQGFNDIERWRNNEEIGRYKFVAINNETSDKFSVSVMLPGEWNRKPAIWLSVWIGARYRKVDLQ